MKKNELLLSRLMEYGKSDAYPFHMPGHKRRIAGGVPEAFPNPFAIDITEIEGFDNLHHAEGILRESMDWAAGVYGSDQTYYLVNGSSGGILSAVSAAVSHGGKILMSRNCHKSAYHAVILNRLQCAYVYPQRIAELGIQGGILPSDVEKTLQENPDVQAVLIVSPTYDGIVSDIEEIAKIVHKHKIPLIVDEAHGAHFSFGGFPVSAVQCGADLVIQSLHKTLPSLTQTAVLHARRGYVDLEKLERYLQMFQTSSPSYVFLASMERCIYELAEHGNAELLHFHGRLDRVRAALRGMKHLRLMDFSKEVPNRKNENGVFDFDPAKLVVSCRNCVRVNADGSREQLDGNGLSDWLRTQFHLEMEMCGADYIVAIASYPDSEEGLGRLVAALTEIDKNLECADRKIPETTPEMQNAVSGEKPDGYDEAETPWDLPQIVLPMAEALEQKSCPKPLAACAGSISGEFIYLYPPGIPIAAPGERVTERIVERVLHYQRMGLPVQGMADVAAKSLRVCVPEQGAADR